MSSGEDTSNSNQNWLHKKRVAKSSSSSSFDDDSTIENNCIPNGKNGHLSSEKTDSDISHPEQNGVSNRARKNKRRKKSFNGLALRGWDGTFPNLSSNHSLESNSDLDVQLPTDLRAIGATGLSIFPREVEQQQQQSPPPPQQQQRQASPMPTSSSRSSSVAQLPSAAITATITTAARTTTTSTTTTTANPTNCAVNSTSASPKLTQASNNINNSDNNNHEDNAMPSASSCRLPSELSTEPESESDAQTDFANQKRKNSKSQSPAAGNAAKNLCNVPSPSGSTQERNEPPKRISSPSQASKRKRSSDQEKDSHFDMRNRAKSLEDLNPAQLVIYKTRSTSVCILASEILVRENCIEKEIKLLERKSPSKTSAGRRPVAPPKRVATDEFFCMPFEYGWKRELVMRCGTGSSRQRMDVTFIAPDGKKLRSREEISPYLTGELTLDHFCFIRQLQHVGDEYESVRYAKPAPARRKSLLAAKQQQAPMPTVSGKRIPKPKVPKGASPPPEGWTSTMAVKGNARVLAASNGNLSGSAGTSAGNSARKRGSNQTKQSTKPATVTKTPVPEKKCAICLQTIKWGYSTDVTSTNLICAGCVNNDKRDAPHHPPKADAARGQTNGVKKGERPQKTKSGGTGKALTDEHNGSSNGSLLEIGGEIELPGALPPDQLLSDEPPAQRAGNKITPKPLEVVVINGRKAIAVAGEPPRSRLQVLPREPEFDFHEKFSKRNSSAKGKRQGFVELMSTGNLNCQLIQAVMKTLDMHDRMNMSKVCKTWAMVGRDRTVWRTVKLRDTYISNWNQCLRNMARNRTVELDMMGVIIKDTPTRMDGDLTVLKPLRILRTDPCEAKFIEAITWCLPRLDQLRATCTTPILDLGGMKQMTNLKILRLRMTDPKAVITSMNALQCLKNLTVLGLRGISKMTQSEIMYLGQLHNIHSLSLGCCRNLQVEKLLPNFCFLRRLRIENTHSNWPFDISPIMKAVAELKSVQSLELINVNVDIEFSRLLGACDTVHELLLMPNFHNNTANMMNYIIQAISENSDMLKSFLLGITFELLSVTRTLVTNLEKDCVPVALPIPGVPDNDVLNKSDEPIAYMPVDRLQSILHHMMPQAWLIVAKVPQSDTASLKFKTALPFDSAVATATKCGGGAAS